jgi:2-amino-4-hydroxy-6-hydroxymethyldihydropteridine diphosphokinase
MTQPRISKKVLLSLGSNIGDRLSYLKKAGNELEKLDGFRILFWSSIMETSPVGVKGQDNYLNAVLLAETSIPPLQLLKEFKAIETRLGRKDRPRWAEREIDIDILTYEGVKMETDELTLPHKELTNRLFALKGCAELVPEMKTLYQSRFEVLSRDQIVIDTEWQNIGESGY